MPSILVAGLVAAFTASAFAAPIATTLPRTFLADPADVLANINGLPGGAPLAAVWGPIADDAAGWLLNSANPSVTDKNAMSLPPGATLNDYVSLAPNWWPDYREPTGLPFFRVDGCTNPNARTEDKAHWAEFAEGVSSLALAAFAAGSRTDVMPQPAAVYVQRALALVRTFIVEPATRMEPNLAFAQGRVGREPGPYAWAIDVVGSAEVVDALGILEAQPGWDPAVREATRKWFADLLKWLEDKRAEAGQSAAINNIRTSNEIFVLAVRLYLNESVTTDDVTANCVARYTEQISANGSMPEEIARSDSWHYTAMAVTYLTRFARLTDRISATGRFGSGPCWLAGDRALLRAADYMLPPLLLIDIGYWTDPIRGASTSRVDLDQAAEAMYALYRATGNSTYLQAAVNAYGGFEMMQGTIWDNLVEVPRDPPSAGEAWPAGAQRPRWTDWDAGTLQAQTRECGETLDELYRGTQWEGYEKGGWPVATPTKPDLGGPSGGWGGEVVTSVRPTSVVPTAGIPTNTQRPISSPSTPSTPSSGGRLEWTALLALVIWAAVWAL